VTKVISPTTYKLDLPHDFEIHDVFHTNLLRHDPDDALPGQIPTPPPPLVLVENEELNEWEVEEILDSRYRGRGVQYLVRYSGHPQPSWQPSRDLTNCDEALLAYHHTNSTKPVVTAFGLLLQAHMRVDPQRLALITVNHSNDTYSDSSNNAGSNDGDGDSYSNSDGSSDTNLEDGLQEEDALAHSAVDLGDSPNSKNSRRSSTCIMGGNVTVLGPGWSST